MKNKLNVLLLFLCVIYSNNSFSIEKEKYCSWSSPVEQTKLKVTNANNAFQLSNSEKATSLQYHLRVSN